MAGQPSLAPESLQLPPISLHIRNAVPVPRQVLSKDRWEELKPLIHRLYIDENKKFQEVAAILRDSYGFLPTKKQFDTRVKSWGLKKNLSQSERHAVIKSGVIGRDGKVPSMRSRKRWEKEFEKLRSTSQESSECACSLFSERHDLY